MFVKKKSWCEIQISIFIRFYWITVVFSLSLFMAAFALYLQSWTLWQKAYGSINFKIVTTHPLIKEAKWLGLDNVSVSACHSRETLRMVIYWHNDIILKILVQHCFFLSVCSWNTCFIRCTVFERHLAKRFFDEMVYIYLCWKLELQREVFPSTCSCLSSPGWPGLG